MSNPMTKIWCVQAWAAVLPAFSQLQGNLLPFEGFLFTNISKPNTESPCPNCTVLSGTGRGAAGILAQITKP